MRIAWIGAAAWGVFSFLTGLATTVVMLAIVRSGSGIGKAVVDPTHNSLIADYYAIDVRPRRVLVPPRRQRGGQLRRAADGGLLALLLRLAGAVLRLRGADVRLRRARAGACASRCGGPRSAGRWGRRRKRS